MSEPDSRPYLNTDLLASDFVPSEENTQSLLAAIASQNAKLEHIDAEIPLLETRLSELRAARIALAASRDVNRSFLAPLRRVPTEIMGHIFLHVPQGRKAILPSESPLLLLRVCRRLRRIVLNTPRLWTHLILKPQLFTGIEEYLQHLAEMWFSNSGTLPIHLTIPDPYWDHQHEQLMQTVVQNFHRFRSIQGYLGRHFLRVLSSQSLPLCAAALRSVIVADGTWSLGLTNGSHLEPRLNKCIHAPYLIDVVSLGLSGIIDLFDFPGANLRRLVFGTDSNISPPPVQLLLLGHSLSTLEVISEGDLTHDMIGHDLVSLPVLHTLRVRLRPPANIFPFLDVIRAPKLKTLHVDLLQSDITSQAFFDSYCSLLGANTSIQQLTLMGFRLDSIGFIPMLPELQTLCLSNCRHTKSVLQALTPDPSSSPSSWTCPQLCAIWIDNSKVHGTLLVELVRSRTRVAAGGTILSRMDITRCNRFDDSVKSALFDIANGLDLRIKFQRQASQRCLILNDKFYDSESFKRAFYRRSAGTILGL